MNIYAIIFILFGTLLSCKPTITCEDVPCPFGQFCSEAGVCEFAVEKCEANSDCPVSEICDLDENICIAEQLPCTDTFACPLAQNCNALTGFCEPDSICSRDGCGVGETCNETTEECTATRCTPNRSECPVRFVCGTDGICSLGCLVETDCPQEEFCLIQASEGRGACVPSCSIDTDCPFGTTCELVGEKSRCEREPSCVLDNECRTDEVCVSGNCIQPPCSGNEDCELYQFCDLARGKCTNLDCDDDIYSANTNSPNVSLENAARLELGDYRNLRVCPGTQDWFKISFRSTDIVTVDVNIQEGSTLEIRVFDTEGKLLSRDSRLESRRRFEFSPLKTGDVFFEFAAISNEKSIYDFKIQREFCANDIYEENDLKSQAKNIPALVNAPVTLPLNACPNDVDWFAFRNLGGDHGLNLSFSQATFEIEGILITPQNEEIIISKDAPLQALKLGESGDYFVRIAVPDQNRGAFNLTVESKPTWLCPDAGLNSTTLTAVPASAAIGSHFLCPEDIGFETDWVSLPVLDGVIQIDLSTSIAYDMDVVLWSGDADAPVLYRDSTHLPDGRRVIYFEADPNENYYLRISSDASGERLLTTPGYTIGLTVE